MVLLEFALVFLGFTAANSQNSVSKSSGPPPFFLQDPTDGLCLQGEKYKRCAIDTLWYVSGKPGQYQIHHRVANDEPDIDTCLAKFDCHTNKTHTTIGTCNHCGSKKWNILGEAESGLFSPP